MKRRRGVSLEDSYSRGDNYNRIKRTISIALINYKLEELKDLEQMHTIWNWREKGQPQWKLTDLQELHIIDMTEAENEYRKGHRNLLAI